MDGRCGFMYKDIVFYKLRTSVDISKLYIMNMKCKYILNDYVHVYVRAIAIIYAML
jgi:hypothetical protein